MTDRAHCDWDPECYQLFAEQRARPAKDLLARLTEVRPKVVFDLGCGTGTITQPLAELWPGARVVGVDRSQAMLAEARQRGNHIRWIEADLASWTGDEPADLLFSNAALHWLDHHEGLFPRLIRQLAPGGILAVQMPRNFEEPSHRAIAETIEAGPWRERLLPLFRPHPVASPTAYVDILAPVTSFLDIWETIYIHILEGANPVVAWTGGATLRPLLAALRDNEQVAFIGNYSARIARAYPRRADGKTLFSFRRLFIVATR